MRRACRRVDRRARSGSRVQSEHGSCASEVVSRHRRMALANAMEHQKSYSSCPRLAIFAENLAGIAGSHIAKTIAVGIVVLAVILFFILWAGQVYMEAKGTLEPVERRTSSQIRTARVDKLLVIPAIRSRPTNCWSRFATSKLETKIADLEGKAAWRFRTHWLHPADLGRGIQAPRRTARTVTRVNWREKKSRG